MLRIVCGGVLFLFLSLCLLCVRNQQSTPQRKAELRSGPKYSEKSLLSLSLFLSFWSFGPGQPQTGGGTPGLQLFSGYLGSTMHVGRPRQAPFFLSALQNLLEAEPGLGARVLSNNELRGAIGRCLFDACCRYSHAIVWSQQVKCVCVCVCLKGVRKSCWYLFWQKQLLPKWLLRLPELTKQTCGGGSFNRPTSPLGERYAHLLAALLRAEASYKPAFLNL